MPISFGRKHRIAQRAPGKVFSIGDRADRVLESSLVDLRNPQAFASGFIPGSYNVPDLACAAAAQRTGLFHNRRIYLLAESEEQLLICSDAADLGKDIEIAGWFDTDALDEWHKANTRLSTLEAVNADTLCIRAAAWNTVILDIHDGRERRQPAHGSALTFAIEDLAFSMDGLPTQTSLCLVAETCCMASFAASLLCNLGFHNVSYLSSGCLPKIGTAPPHFPERK